MSISRRWTIINTFCSFEITRDMLRPNLLALTMSRQDRATTDRNTRTLRELVKRPENKLCADCKRNGTYTVEVIWISYNVIVVPRSSMGFMEYVCLAQLFVLLSDGSSLVVCSCVSDAQAFTAEWARISARSSR